MSELDVKSFDDTQNRGHYPVLFQESLNALKCDRGGKFVDATLGGGGHSEGILQVHNQNEVLGIDQDLQILKQTKSNLDKKWLNRFSCAHGRFSQIQNLMNQHGWEAVDGILADLGVSSFQLDQAERGFSFRTDGPLDMRMDSDDGVDAREWLQDVDETELANVIWEYGEERFSRRIAKAIVSKRKEIEFATTKQLADVIFMAYPPPARHGRIHPATRTFQALRIFLNSELEELETFLETAPRLLNPGGILVVISYHSLEDRRVKHAFRALAQDDFELPFRKPIVPSAEEVSENRRSRSAKLRALQKGTSS